MNLAERASERLLLAALDLVSRARAPVLGHFPLLASHRLLSPLAFQHVHRVALRHGVEFEKVLQFLLGEGHLGPVTLGRPARFRRGGGHVPHAARDVPLEHLPLEYLLLDSPGGHESVNRHRTLLTVPPHPRERLQVVRGVPVAVEEHEPVRAHQIKTHAARFGAQQENIPAASGVEAVDQRDALVGRDGPVEPRHLPAHHDARLSDDIQRGGVPGHDHGLIDSLPHTLEHPDEHRQLAGHRLVVSRDSGVRGVRVPFRKLTHEVRHASSDFLAFLALALRAHQQRRAVAQPLQLLKRPKRLRPVSRAPSEHGAVERRLHGARSHEHHVLGLRGQMFRVDVPRGRSVHELAGHPSELRAPRRADPFLLGGGVLVSGRLHGGAENLLKHGGVAEQTRAREVHDREELSEVVLNRRTGE